MEVQVESNASWKNLTCQINCVSVVGYWIECITFSLRSLLYHFWNNQLINQKLLFCAHLFYLSNHKLKPSFYFLASRLLKISYKATILLLVGHTMLTFYHNQLEYWQINRFNKFIFLYLSYKTITNLAIQIYRLV